MESRRAIRISYDVSTPFSPIFAIDLSTTEIYLSHLRSITPSQQSNCSNSIRALNFKEDDFSSLRIDVFQIQLQPRVQNLDPFPLPRQQLGT